MLVCKQLEQVSSFDSYANLEQDTEIRLQRQSLIFEKKKKTIKLGDEILNLPGNIDKPHKTR